MGNSQGQPKPANVYELVITTSKELESLLETEFGATGRGLHERITSVQSQLTPALVKRMRYLATLRNKVVHGEQLPNLDGYEPAFEQSKAELQNIIARRRAGNARRPEPNTECTIL